MNTSVSFFVGPTTVVPAKSLLPLTTHILFLLFAGLILLGTFILPALLKDRLLSLPIIYIGIGFLMFSLPLDLPLLNPEDRSLDRQMMEYLTEFIVIISLAGTGLKINRTPSWENWSSGLLLLLIVMPLTIVLVGGLGYLLLGLAPATAILLGAILAPTDPVLAAQVQVGPPKDDTVQDEVRFSLTLEAGLNDGLAFPFVYLAIGSLAAGSAGAYLAEWLWWDVAYRVIVGTLAGLLAGYLLSTAFRYFKEKIEAKQDTEVEEGFFALAAVLITYAATEAIEGYGFLAVFVAAVVSAQRRSTKLENRQKSFEAVDQIEQAALGFFLIAFGGVLATGGLQDLTWTGVLISLALIFVIRPLAGIVGFLPTKLPWEEKAAISYFGIRGVGSLYYLAYAHNSGDFSGIDTVWSIINFTILVSIVLHGISVKPVLNWVDQRMGRKQ